LDHAELVNITKLSQPLCNTYFYELRGRQTQGPPRAANTLATPLMSAYLLCSTAMWRDIRAAWGFSGCELHCCRVEYVSIHCLRSLIFWSWELRWRSTECVLLSCF